jgi:hypothetical protein
MYAILIQEVLDGIAQIPIADGIQLLPSRHGHDIHFLSNYPLTHSVNPPSDVVCTMISTIQTCGSTTDVVAY